MIIINPKPVPMKNVINKHVNRLVKHEGCLRDAHRRGRQDENNINRINNCAKKKKKGEKETEEEDDEKEEVEEDNEKEEVIEEEK